MANMALKFHGRPIINAETFSNRPKVSTFVKKCPQSKCKSESKAVTATFNLFHKTFIVIGQPKSPQSDFDFGSFHESKTVLTPETLLSVIDLRM